MPRILIAVTLAAASLLADTEIRSTLTAGGQTTDSVVYSKRNRQRIEYGKAAILLQQCDRQRTLQLDEQSKTYFVMSTTPLIGGHTAAAAESPRQGGETTINTTVTDTGEAKPWFAYTARRVRTKVETIPGPGSCQAPVQTVVETDGWYIDLPVESTSSCSLDAAQAPPVPTASCTDKVKLNSTGTSKAGFPIAYTITTTTGGKTNSITMEITELDVKSPLADSLFEIPEGYSDVNARKPGQARVALAMPTDKTGQAADLANHVFRSLRQAGLEPMAMPKGSASDIDARARQTNADFVLYSELTELKKPEKPAATGKRFGNLVGKATGLLNQKEAWEARLDYRLFAVGSPAPLLSATAAGKTGGESLNVRGALSLATNVGMMVAMGPMGMMMQGGFMSSLMQMNTMGGGLMGGGLRGGMPGLGIGGLNPALGGLSMLGMAGNAGMGGAMGFAGMGDMGAGGAVPSTNAEVAKAWQAAVADMTSAVLAQVKK